MNAETDLLASESEAIRQYADWYARQGYKVSVQPRPRDLPAFLRPLAPDMIVARDGENIVVEVKTSSPASFEKVQRLARALEHRAGWTLQVVYADLADPEWEPPAQLPKPADLRARLESLVTAQTDDDQSRLQVLLLWSMIEAAARHRLVSVGIAPTDRISSSALIKMLVTEGIIEEEQYTLLRRGLAVRNAIAHGFLNQPIDPNLLDALRDAARTILDQKALANA